ncbi:UDP-4-amino-4,6-dideoxy-N-acetyl-beta-L-altrosamine transaminase [Gymnodinialimonas hymeniacidonis]|uniref:UDP-4-amino-4, 6-dideoxy-N-acetyl-beta-L-altrosamine transaminase n=1 Tax=Gymnodinialimonas hymeniacidonis TaxID=3126508 RepID=UPI0034C64AD5
MQNTTQPSFRHDICKEDKVMIPYGRQSISDDDVAAVSEVLRSDFLTQGPRVPEFEQAVAAYCGVAHGVAMNSATSALHVACMALDVGPGDLVWTSPISFVASANCARYCGADVDFVDIDPANSNMSAALLADKLAAAKASGRLPKVVIPVHLAGRSCDMAAIADLANEYGFSVIEDASHAIGGRYYGNPIGCCEFSDITVFSFHPVKIVTSAEGGMAMTEDPELASRMERLRSHGITRDEGEMHESPHGPWYYEQVELGYNYRMTDLQAALGLSQFGRIETFIEARHKIAARYDTLLPDLPIKLPVPVPTDQGRSGLHLYPVRVDQTRGAPPRAVVFRRLRAAGIGVQVHYIPIHIQPDFKQFGFEHGQYPAAEAYYAEALSLPMFPALTEEDQDTVVAALTLALKA